ncbi:hypothetical protein MRS44_010508 [Fusarium solani]|uniref:uncharacterized protein n=1 Tax=Fusarium solani TaxID=169388 RepID=UPI0032C3DFD3|nr:hypothetical protein MRS44_010508 [Fusarium solani]
MADPFGVTAVALSALKIAHVLHGIITDLKEVPNQLLALSNETCNLKFVLDSVQDLTRRQDTAESFDRQLGPLLFQARVKLDLDARNCDGHTPAEKVELRDEVPQGFHRAWDRLIQSIVNKDFDPGSWATTPASGNESWYSFDDVSWYEAEAVVQEDVKNAEKEQEEEEDRDKEAERASTPESEPNMTEEEMVKELSKRLEEVSARDMAHG